jgi:RHS repeat-associated protein
MTSTTTNTTASTTARTAKGEGVMTGLLNTRLLAASLAALILASGLLTSHGALAAANDKDHAQQTKQSDTGQADGKDNGHEDKQAEPGHDGDDLPTITLTAPADNSASLYPAAFTVQATVTFPGKAGEHRDQGESVEVEFLSNGQKFAETERAPYQATFIPPKPGTYILTAQIRYGEGHRTILSNAVTVVSDLPPTVSLTAPANNTVVTAPATFALSVTATAPIGTIAKVEFYNGTTLIGTATTASGGSYSTTWSNVPYGSYSITAKATDNYGFSTTSNPVAVISNQPPTVSLTSPAANAVSVAPGSFTISANAADVDGTIAKVKFYNGATLLGTVTAAPYTYTWSNVAAGTYRLTAVATDNLGAATTSAAVSVTSDALPTVSLTSPAANAVSIAPGSFTLTANAASTTSTIARVDFYANNGTSNTLIGTATAAPYTYAWSSVPVGSYTFTAVATDALNATSTSSQITVTVNTGIAQAYYIHTDQLDTPREITDSNGNVVWRWDNQDPFGNNVPNQNQNGAGQFSFNLRFPGQYADTETNTHYNIRRDYDPSISRYVESDPIGLGGGINTYAYVGGNPLSYVDPKGLAGILPGPVPLPIPGPINPPTTKPKPGEPLDPYIEQPSPNFPPSSGPNLPESSGGGGICEAALKLCLKGANSCGSFKPVVATACYSAFIICKSATFPHDPPPSP